MNPSPDVRLNGPSRLPAEDPAVVALGGGHGLAASLAALRRVTSTLTAVVTVADNGGSSGRLRTEFGVLPPGDLRMALAALCGDDRWGRTWAEVLQHRFAGDGELDGHALGNLLIVTLWELLGDHVVGLDWVGGLLGARGRVLPMATDPIDIVAQVRGADPAAPEVVTSVRGQVEVATTAGRLLSVALEPHQPAACPQAVTAIEAADHVVLGPGSWYTSVVPHLLVPGLRAALERTTARVVLTTNLVAQTEETRGYTLSDHLRALREVAPGLHIDTVLVHDPTAGRPAYASGAGFADGLVETAASLGARVLTADVAAEEAGGVHDPAKLAVAYEFLMRTGEENR